MSHSPQTPRHDLLRLIAALVLAAAAPWPQTATQDLAVMHDLIADNHPGAVDPQNPGFRAWLDGGHATLLPQARAARTLHDYQLVLRTYANGFADGHLNVAFTDQPAHLWPGFLARADGPGAPLRVATPGAAPDFQPGAIIKSCGGIPAATLLADRIEKPRP